jgi:hypothetical protein
VAGELGYDTGPFVTLAVFCDQAIEDKQGVVTLIRIVDQVTLQAAGEGAPKELPPGQAINTTLVIGLKAGKARGRQDVQVTFVHPDGTQHPGPDIPVHFSQGDHQGMNVILQAGVILSDAGVYWAEVSVNKRLVTKTPLEVRYEVTQPGIQVGP